MNVLTLQDEISKALSVEFVSDILEPGSDAYHIKLSFSVPTRLFDDPEDFLCKMAVYKIVEELVNDYELEMTHESSSKKSFICWHHTPCITKDSEDCSFYAKFVFLKGK